MSKFDEFWEAWPVNGKAPFQEYSRKINRKKCAEKWLAMGYNEQADVIINDVIKRAKFDKSWLGNNGKYLCAPLVYLNNERWLDDSGMADIRDRDHKRTDVVGTGMEFPEVRRGVYELIRKDYDSETILRTFDITPEDLYDARQNVEKVEGAKF